MLAIHKRKHGGIVRLNRVNEMEHYILQHGTASLEELAHVFEISINTVRRDIATLMERGHIRKTYGGVAALDPGPITPMAVRSVKNQEGKQKIGAMAASLVLDGQTIFLDSGSTVLAMIPYLAERKNVTIVTHSLCAMYEAAKFPNLNVIALGGQYSRSTSSYVGISTLDSLQRLRVDTVFIAATGVSLERGLTNTTFFEAEIKQKVVQQGQTAVVLLADHSKFGYASTISFFPFEKLTAIVTDKCPAQSYLDVINSNHIQLLCADAESLA